LAKNLLGTDVLNYQTYTGTSARKLQRLVRHYYMRRQPNQANSSESAACQATQRAEPCDCKTASSAA